MSTILIIAAHPDDEVLGVGGTITKFREKGYEIYTHIVTDGSSTQYEGNKAKLKLKKNEALKANEILGIEKIYFGKLPDMKLDTIPHVEINKEIERIINKVKPEIVFTHNPEDINKDHKLIFESTLVACRPTQNSSVKGIYAYETLSSTEWSDTTPSKQFSPNFFIKLNKKNIDKKCEAMSRYKTELREYPHPRSIRCIKNHCQFRGNQVGFKYAEAFRIVRKLEV